MEIEMHAKYPFLSDSKQFASSKNIGFSDLYLEAGAKRALAAIGERGEIPKFAPGGLESVVVGELAAYTICRMIVSTLANRYYINRLAVAESKRARGYLDYESDENLRVVAVDLGVGFEAQGPASGTYSKGHESFRMPLHDYVRFCPKTADYRLVRQDVAHGFVSGLKRERLTRVLEEAIRKRIESGMPVRGEFPQQIVRLAQKLKKLLPVQQVEVVKIPIGNYPPCIKKIISDLAASVNVPHTSRWALAVYLVSAGVTTEDIVKLFTTAPDFNEQTTRYQVEHVRSKAYRMPSCASMDSWGICIASCRCFNPLKFDLRVHGRNIRQHEEESGKGD